MRALGPAPGSHVVIRSSILLVLHHLGLVQVGLTHVQRTVQVALVSVVGRLEGGLLLEFRLRQTGVLTLPHSQLHFFMLLLLTLSLGVLFLLLLSLLASVTPVLGLLYVLGLFHFGRIHFFFFFLLLILEFKLLSFGLLFLLLFLLKSQLSHKGLSRVETLLVIQNLKLRFQNILVQRERRLEGRLRLLLRRNQGRLAIGRVLRLLLHLKILSDGDKC